jgi:hypothetical protein
MYTLTEIIFNGKRSEINMPLVIEYLLTNYRDSRFNFPEDSSSKTIQEVIAVFNSNSYVDFVVTFDEFNIGGAKNSRCFYQFGG